MIKRSVNIFAYGSNLHLQRMRDRVPSAVPARIGYVREHRIAFHKRSADGSAKANAQFTAQADDRIWGVVYSISASQLPHLDQHEFLGIGYDRTWTKVITQTGVSTEAWMYVAVPSAIDHAIRPYSWYLEFVVRGAYQHRLPFCYIADLHAVDSEADPDPVRDRTHRHILTSEASCSLST